jgi:hypothetical protein
VTRRRLAALLFGSLVLALTVSACGGGGTRYEVVPNTKNDQSDQLGGANHVLCVRVRDPKKPERKLDVCGQANFALAPYGSSDTPGIYWFCGEYDASSQTWLGYPSVDVTDPAYKGQAKDCDRMVSVVKKSGVLSDV